MWDVPGATYDDTPPVALLDAMLDATGIILLIDPGHRPPQGVTAYYTSFFQATLGALALRLRRRLAGRADPRLDDQNRLRIPLAICLTSSCSIGCSGGSGKFLGGATFIWTAACSGCASAARPLRRGA